MADEENNGPKQPQNTTVTDKLASAVKKQSAIAKEFNEFISRGNVIDMAVGIIVGSAFTAIVTSLVNDMLMPVIGMVLAGINFKSIQLEIPWGNHPVIAFGSFIQSVINFILIAMCVFLLIKSLNAFTRRKKEEKPTEPPKPSKEEILLTEIRDILKYSSNENK